MTDKKPAEAAASVVSFGCRLNIWESEVVARHLQDSGLSNAVVINSCAVTAEAERQARQEVRRHARANPDARIIVTGCAAQINPENWQAMPEVAAVIGNHDKLQAQTWQRLAGSNDAGLPSLVSDIMAVRDVAPHLLEGFDSHSRAFLQIQQGCDHRCTFCIIPQGRGGNRSVPVETVISQVETLVANGVAEIVLTGVDIASWGSEYAGDAIADDAAADKWRLGSLVAAILKAVPALPRLRLSSLDPAVMDRQLLEVLAEEPRLMPHLHLSVQHGDDLILKRMKRRHDRAGLLAFVEAIRKARPDVVFGADLIAGFPTEDEAAHQANLEIISAAGLTWLHVFPYSPREGTPAARMPQLERAVVRDRAAALRAAGEAQASRFHDQLVGKQDIVLVESGGIGHTRQFARARLVAPEGMKAPAAGQLCRVQIAASEGSQLRADIISGGMA